MPPHSHPFFHIFHSLSQPTVFPSCKIHIYFQPPFIVLPFSRRWSNVSQCARLLSAILCFLYECCENFPNALIFIYLLDGKFSSQIYTLIQVKFCVYRFLKYKRGMYLCICTFVESSDWSFRGDIPFMIQNSNGISSDSHTAHIVSIDTKVPPTTNTEPNYIPILFRLTILNSFLVVNFHIVRQSWV